MKIDAGLMGTADFSQIPEQARALEAQGFRRHGDGGDGA